DPAMPFLGVHLTRMIDGSVTVGPNAVEHSHYLRIYMGHLRQKLEQDPARPRHFITETGIGYRFML
nr:winged helix-turn-helix domain-containing protein [Escherichia coli]